MQTPRLTIGTRLLTCFGLLLAAAGVLIQMGSGVDAVPHIPLSFAILIIAAGIVWFGARWWWAPLVAVLFALVDGLLIVLAARADDRLTTPSDLWPYTGTAMHVIGLLVACIAGVLATRKGYLHYQAEPERERF